MPSARPHENNAFLQQEHALVAHLHEIDGRGTGQPMVAAHGHAQRTMMWDFWSLSPESPHQVTILFSDRGTPWGYRHMTAFRATPTA